MKNLNISPDFIKQLKLQILAGRYVVKIANAGSLRLCYTLGKIIDNRFEQEKWGAKVLDTISKQLQQELPGLRGFSGSNLRKMRLFYNFWKDEISILPSLTDKLDNYNPMQKPGIPPYCNGKTTKKTMES